jgi:large subunit ribosomal protein L9
MQIILQEDVDKLGNRGEVVEVAEGYARNYLLPRKLAMEASAGNLKRLERLRTTFATREATERGDAEKLAEGLNGVTINLQRKAGESEQLFGSVNAADIAEALAAQGYTVDRRKIQLKEPIKMIGDYQVPVKLHREIVANLNVKVARET